MPDAGTVAPLGGDAMPRARHRFPSRKLPLAVELTDRVGEQPQLARGLCELPGKLALPRWRRADHRLGEQRRPHALQQLADDPVIGGPSRTADALTGGAAVQAQAQRQDAGVPPLRDGATREVRTRCVVRHREELDLLVAAQSPRQGAELRVLVC